jgi:outer membrane protein OmpA-like peptidoglycan-associated protein
MKNQIIMVLMSSILCAGVVQAQEPTQASKQEAMGVGSGAVIGAVAGGPVGFIVGAAFGGWLGDRFFERTEERDQYLTALNGTRSELATANDQRLAAENELQLSAERHQAEESRWTEALARSVNVSVLFKTGESSVDADTAMRLGQLAGLINELGPVLVDVAGHADARGSEDLNEQLSADRALAVREILVSHGVSTDRITTAALGETYSGGEEAGVDQHALDRRVEIRLDVTSPDRLARSD